MSTRDLLIPYALRDGQLVHIDQITQAERGRACLCRCPNDECKGELWAKLGAEGKSKGKVRHFAHAVDTPHCTPETVLHETAKLLIFKRLNEAITAGASIQMKWHCSKCNKPHDGDLLKIAKSVRLEKGYINTRPDVSLYADDGRMLIALEVIVTHAPEADTIKTYEENKVVRVDVRLKSFEDLTKLTGPGPVLPDFVSKCPPSPPAPPSVNPVFVKPVIPEVIQPVATCRCGGSMFPREFIIATWPCWKCNKHMKLVYGRFNGEKITPIEMKGEELRLAESQGAKFKWIYSSLHGRSIPCNCCPHCGSAWRNDHLFGEIRTEMNLISTLAGCDYCNQVRTNPKCRIPVCGRNS